MVYLKMKNFGESRTLFIKRVLAAGGKSGGGFRNLARAFGEKARNGFDSGDYRQAWLNMTAALKQKIPGDKLHLQPDLMGALINREVVNKTFCERWFSPSSHSHSSTVFSVAFSPDGKTLASGSWDMTIRLWDMETQKETATWTGHSRTVTSVAFSPDGKTLASGSWDMTIRQWDLSIYFDFLNAGKPTPLFFTFTEGVEFLWGVKLEGFEYIKVDERSKDTKFRPLLAAPAKDQSKFDQILEWAKEQQKREN